MKNDTLWVVEMFYDKWEFVSVEVYKYEARRTIARHRRNGFKNREFRIRKFVPYKEDTKFSLSGCNKCGKLQSCVVQVSPGTKIGFESIMVECKDCGKLQKFGRRAEMMRTMKDAFLVLDGDQE